MATFGLSDTCQQDNCRITFNKECVDIIQKTDLGYVNAWQNEPGNFCISTLESNILQFTGELKEEGVTWARSQIGTLFDLYFTNGIQEDGKSGNFQTHLYDLCLKYPGICTEGLQKQCAKFTRTDLENKEGIIDMCGCYLQSGQYSIYENLYGLPKVCDPLCAREGVIPFASINPQKCTSSICIIDSAVLDIGGSGTVNFNQVCGGCSGESSCVCRIHDIQIKAAEAKLGDVDLTQKCKGDLQCHDLTGKIISCDRDISPPIIQNNTGKITIIISVALLVLLILLIIFIVYKRNNGRTQNI
uniref:Transmembrane protein n=1 Tax=Pithovirus LCDPAC01 TaxID=2506600 RepID=A0A481YNX0_9VIRU|nr:MAG: transmembrane protein [Pithovirus LCDPAC01]